MEISTQMAKHLREVYFGGNWTCVNLKDTLENITWKQATTKINTFNTIAALSYHINYFIKAVLEALNKELLTSKDALSFNHPPINNQNDWENFLENLWIDAELLTKLIEQLDHSQLKNNFIDAKYGNYYRNIHGIIEHAHYHLGQITLIKKLL